jgi:hypothetical protein
LWTQPQSVTLVIEKNAAPIDFEYNSNAQILVLRKPNVSAVQNVLRKPNVSAVQEWTIEFN